ncbi:MAG: hypothetical protein KJO07_13890 [Deltaproteobacteria bacterium]|nr:hypothetical protein [Deltaproteobacteria bacterium]
MSEETPVIAQNPFSVRARVIIVVVSLLSLGAGFAMALFGEDMSPPPTADANSYSRSALGHRVAVELLEKLDIPVLVSRHSSGKKAASAILLLAEPELDSGNRAEILKMLDDAHTVLAVLPKRDGYTDMEKPEWIDDSALVPESRVTDTLKALVPGAEIERVAGPEKPRLVNNFEGAKIPTPTPASPLQLMHSEDIEPIIQTETGGILLGYVQSYNLWLLSDPDIIANHGIGKADNAVFWVKLISYLRTDDQTVVVDEVIHGLRAKPSIWRSLFEFPLALVTLQVFLITGILLWAMTGRFGKPVSAGGGLEPGKEFLIDNTAHLLHFGGYSGDMLKRYYLDNIRYVRKRLNTPRQLVGADALQWLDRVAAARGVNDDLQAIDKAVAEAISHARRNPRRVASTARRIHRWKEEMLHGPATRSAN